MQKNLETGHSVCFPIGEPPLAAALVSSLEDDLSRSVARLISTPIGTRRRERHPVGQAVERTEIGGPGEFDDMSNAELLAGLRERFARLEQTLAISEGSVAVNGDGVTRTSKDHETASHRPLKAEE